MGDSFTSCTGSLKEFAGSIEYCRLFLSMIGYMIFEIKSYFQGSIADIGVLPILALCCFGLSFHAVYSEHRMDGSFQFIRICEDTCEYYERHGFVSPALFFYAKLTVRDHEESKRFSDMQTDLIAFIANRWLNLAFVCTFVFGCVAAVKLVDLAKFYHIF